MQSSTDPVHVSRTKKGEAIFFFAFDLCFLSLGNLGDTMIGWCILLSAQKNQVKETNSLFLNNIVMIKIMILKLKL